MSQSQPSLEHHCYICAGSLETQHCFSRSAACCSPHQAPNKPPSPSNIAASHPAPETLYLCNTAFAGSHGMLHCSNKSAKYCFPSQPSNKPPNPSKGG
jgi:hypothetical protein